MKKYTVVEFTVPEEVQDTALGLLALHDTFLGCEQNLDSLKCFFSSVDDESIQSLLQRFQDLLAKSCTINSTRVEEERNWNKEWEESITPIVVDEDIVISPSWSTEQFNQRLNLIVNPQMSFGTGHHATTRMMCRFLKSRVAAGETWMDIGTGTGILAILTAMLGAQLVIAFDNDEWSLLNAKENVERNQLVNRIIVSQEDVFQKELPAVDGISANLFRNIILPNLPKFHSSVKSGGTLLLSGILVFDKEEILTAALKVGFAEPELMQEDEWIAIAFRKP